MLGEPVPWARAAGGKTRGLFTPTKQRNHAAALKILAQSAMASRLPFDVPVRLAIVAEFPVPTTWSNRKRIAALNGEIRPGRRPDGSNLQKQIEDALNGVVFRDDALIVDWHGCKKYSQRARIVVVVTPA